jgi:hypothetical protein
MPFLPFSRIDARPPTTKLSVVFYHRKSNLRMLHPSPHNDRSSPDRRFGDVNAVLLALAIGLAVLDGTCFAAFKLSRAVAPLIHTIPGIDQPWAARGTQATSG